MTDKTDKKLATGIRKGQPESFDELYELYRLPIFNFLYQMVGNVEVAKDLAQESFVAIYKVLAEKKKVENLKAYLYTVARNMALLHLERRSREYIDDDFLQQVPDDSYFADPPRAAGNRKQQADIVKALQMMPERYREVFVLREQAGFSYDRIAEMLDTNKTNVGVMIYRARAKFRELYRMLQVIEKPESEECQRILPLISSWLDGETTSRQERELQAHMNECPFCRLASEQMVDANNTFHCLIPLLVPFAVKAGVMAKVGLAGAIPTSIAAASATGGGASLAGGSASSIAAGTAAGSGSAGAGAGGGTGAGIAAATVVGGLSAKAVGIAAAVLIAAAAAGGGTYVGIREWVRKPAATMQSVRQQLNQFMKGQRDKVEIPENLRKSFNNVTKASQEFLNKNMPNLDQKSINEAAQTKSLTMMDVSALEKASGSAAPSAAPVHFYLEVTKQQGACEVQKITKEMQP